MFAGGHSRGGLAVKLLVGLLLWLACAWPWAAGAAEGGVLWLAPGQDRFSLSAHLQFLEDPSNELTLAEVASPALAPKFRPLPHGILRPVWTDTTYWLRVTLARRDTAAPSPEYIFDLGQSTNVVASLFTPQAAPGGGPAWREAAPLDRGDRPQERPSQFSHFPLPPLSGQPQTIYARVRAPLCLDAFPEIVTRTGFQQRLMQNTLLAGGLLSVLLLLAVYHLAFFYSLRNRSYLWYALFLVSQILFLAFVNGITQDLAPGASLFHQVGLAGTLYGLAMLVRLLFVRSLLPLKTLFPLGDRLLVALIIIFSPVIFLPLLGRDALPWIWFFMALAPLRMVCLLYIGYVCWRRGFAPAGTYILATLPLMLGTLDFLLGSLGVFSPLPFSMYYLQQIGLVFEALVLALALVQQVKVLRRERERIEQAARQQSRENRARLRGLAGELVRSEERQRRALAEDLHDGISQNLATSLFNLRLLARRRSGGTPDPEFSDICDLLRVTLEQTRALTFDISPPVLHDYGLEAALEWLAERVRERHGLPVSFQARGALPGRHESLEANLFRAAQELLVNVVKHAEAGRAEVSLDYRGRLVTVRVDDDGRGMPPGPPERQGAAGFGLFSIRERLRAMGGNLDIQSGPGRGSRVTITAPWPEPKPEAVRGSDEDHHTVGR